VQALPAPPCPPAATASEPGIDNAVAPQRTEDAMAQKGRHPHVTLNSTMPDTVQVQEPLRSTGTFDASPAQTRTESNVIQVNFKRRS